MSISISSNNIASTTGTVTIAGNISANNLADVAFSGDYEDLVNKPTIGSGGTIVDSWHNSDKTQWYRKYDDGFIEQGGICIERQATKIINFSANFTTSNYIIVANSHDYSNDVRVVTIAAKTRTSVTLYVINGNEDVSSNDPFDWYACGY